MRNFRMSGKIVHILKSKECVQHLKELLPSTEIVHLDSKEAVLKEPVEILIASPLEVGSWLCDCPHLKWYQSTWAGVDAVINDCHQIGRFPNAIVTRFGGVLSRHMAEWTIARMVSFERRFDEKVKNQENSFWDQESFLYYRPLYEMTIGIIGFGDIGQTIARRCKDFGMTVLCVGHRERKQEELPDFIDGYKTVSDLSEVLAQSDFICSVVPGTKETIGLYNNEVLKVCSEKRPVFINIGRGSAISEESILCALNSGWVRHVILDVFETEPLPKESPLWQHPRVTISPHVSGCSQEREVVSCFADNYRRYIAGSPLNWIVDLKRGY